MSSSLQYQAYELYCLDYTDIPPKRKLPSELTFENWIKTSTKVEEYLKKARAIRKEASDFQVEKGWK